MINWRRKLPKGTDVTEEELDEINRFKREEVLTDEELNFLEGLLALLKRGIPKLGEAVENEDKFKTFAFMVARKPAGNPNGFESMIIQFHDQLVGIYNPLKSASLRLTEIIEKAGEIADLIKSIEKGDIILASRFRGQNGRGTIARLVDDSQQKHDERTHLKRKIHSLEKSWRLIKLVRSSIRHAITDNLEKVPVDFRAIRDSYLEHRTLDPNAESQKSNYSNLYQHIRQAYESLATLFEELKEGIGHIKDFRDWLLPNIHRDQRMIGFMQRIDSELQEKGFA